MIGPVVVVVAFVVWGVATGGLAGAVIGLTMAVGVVAAVAAGAAVWAHRIGALLEPEEAWALAPRPPGFGELCDRVYERTIR